MRCHVDMLTPEEKWYFDHHGFLILRKVVPEQDIENMIALGQKWHAMKLGDLPQPLTSTADTHPDYSPTIARWINNIQYGDQVFQKLVLNSEIMRVIISLTKGRPTLVDTALTRNTVESDDINFHASGTDYVVCEGELYAGFLNAAISLVDVPDGTGFVCLIGSHKRNFSVPNNISIYQGPPTVINVPVDAGDCIVFTEALYHGARRWTEDYPRMTIFNRYMGNHSGGSPIEPYKYLISNQVYELEQPSDTQVQKEIVRHVVSEFS